MHVCDSHAQKAYICDVSDLPLSLAAFPSHENVRKQCMFSSLGSKMLIFAVLRSFAERACEGMRKKHRAQ